MVPVRTLVLRARESFWFLPAVLGVLSIVVAQLLVSVDQAIVDSGRSLPLLDALSASGGRAVLTTIGSAMLTVAGTSFSITISVLATTSSTYGPRLVRNFMADRANQFVLACFISTFLYAIVVLRSVHTAVDDGTAFVPVVAIHVAVVLGVVDVAVLVFFIHHIASSVQITSLQEQVRRDLSAAVDLVYRPADDTDVTTADPGVDPSSWHVVPSSSDGYVQAVDWQALVRWSVSHERRVDMRVMPGDHVIDGEALVALSAAPPDDERALRSLRACVTVGIARTPAQDVSFALQQLVEIAVRGLASGTNDPYTAVTALDLCAGALVPVWRDRAAVTAHLDDGDVRVVTHWPTVESLLETVVEGVDTYAGDHPIVLAATDRLLDRLEVVSSPARRSCVDTSRHRLGLVRRDAGGGA